MSAIAELLSELRQRNVSLWLEGDRLRYRAAKAALTPDLLAQMKNHKADLIAFLREATVASSQPRPPIVPVDRDHPPLSFAQQRLWFLHQFEPDSSSNNMPVVVRFAGTLDVALLEESLRLVMQRHEVLRTTFPAVKGQPTIAIAPEADLTLSIVDLNHLPAAQAQEAAQQQATQSARQPFDLAAGPTLRVTLFRLSADEHLLLWNLHCIVCDGTSSDIFYQDLTAIYAALQSGQPPTLPPLPLQYVDFAQWQRNWLQGDVLESLLSYWKQQLQGNLAAVELPTDFPRPPLVQTYRGDRYARMLPNSLMADLTSLSQKLGTTLFTTLVAAFQILLHRYSGQDDVLLSFVSSGRNQVEVERVIGFFSNTLILRTPFDQNPTFRELLQRVHRSALDAQAHQDLPFEKLVEEIRSAQAGGRSPLFQVKFALNPPWTNGRGMGTVQLPNLTIESLFGYIYHGKTKFDLALVMREQDQGLGAVFDYNAELFDASTVARMMDHLQMLLEGIVADPDRRISDLPLLKPEERYQLLTEWNEQTAAADLCLHQLFEAQAAQNA
ncbi:MAG: hypothetical protein HC895_10285 [Leptolyngbyaceae cyanobacterium SM1_3_5]|nr:hypothetical protein [Leptolyngbyaceae cyanobacterium SM1_3_5]